MTEALLRVFANSLPVPSHPPWAQMPPKSHSRPFVVGEQWQVAGLPVSDYGGHSRANRLTVGDDICERARPPKSFTSHNNACDFDAYDLAGAAKPTDALKPSRILDP